jgi:hypothetical protein
MLPRLMSAHSSLHEDDVLQARPTGRATYEAAKAAKSYERRSRESNERSEPYGSPNASNTLPAFPRH